ncbi:MAG: heterodisulfide reductase-related iron-sulfur binding cluster [Deltaproteobacteria bacterium]|nr:heterodisulfide reductase-related iron-sulfur binding cluster [Deltaproteobacteria bacterium]
MKENNVSPDLYGELKRLGARDMEVCMQCGNCASACPLSAGENTFPRRIYRYLQLGLRDKLLESPEPWLCYYCGDCNTDCPRGAEPAETMMATRRWLITQYDWTGLAWRFYTSPKTELAAFLGIALFVVLLFLVFHGPVVTDRVELTTFAPVHWVHLGDRIMMGFVFVMLFSNAAHMHYRIMKGTKIPLYLYVTQAPVFFINYLTQKRWGKCGTGPGSAWWRHLFLFSGWVSMEILVMGYLSSFQTDMVQPVWHWTRLLGYYATIALMVASTSMLYSRWFKKEAKPHRYSDFTDVFFLVLIISIATTGIMVHLFRLAGLPLMTYSIYVIHVAICVGMLCLMLPFGKLSHLMYRPLAIFLTTLKAKARRDSQADLATIRLEADETFQSCMQCGACTGVCPWGEVTSYSPRKILRDISLDISTNVSVDEASWTCATCNSCVAHCPRGIGLTELVKSVRRQIVDAGLLPVFFNAAVANLQKDGNPWGGKREDRLDWAKGASLPTYTKEHEYCLFTCCAMAYDTDNGKGSQNAGLALLRLLEHAGVSYGTLGTRENCCGDLAEKIGAAEVAADLARKNTQLFLEAGVSKILTLSPHCLNSFQRTYEGLKNVAVVHSSELLSELVQKGSIRPVHRLDLKVTYHDPCYLGRHSAVYEAPRRILESNPGVTLIEMQNSRERSFCCGGGSGGPWKNGAGKENLAGIRIKEAIGTGAEVIATACPYCIRMLNESITRMNAGDRLKVLDISELLLQSVDLSDAMVKTGKKDSGALLGFSQEELHV